MPKELDVINFSQQPVVKAGDILEVHAKAEYNVKPSRGLGVGILPYDSYPLPEEKRTFIIKISSKEGRFWNTYAISYLEA